MESKVKLNEIAEVIDSAHKTPTYSQNGYPMVRCTDVRYGNLDLSKTLLVDEDVYKEFSTRYKPSLNDIIITRVGSYGLTAKVTDTNFCLGQNTSAIKPQKINPHYLYYALNSKYVREQIEAMVVGTTQKTLSLKAINNLEIPRLSKDKEEKIAHYLKSLDDKIILNQEMNKTLESMAQAIFKYWFVDFEPFGGVMPSDWKEKTLEDVCSLVTKGITPKYNDSSEEIIINQKCIRDNKINLNLSRRHTPKKINEKWLQFGDVLINSTGAGTLGRAAQSFYKQDNLTVDSHVTIIRPKSEIFLYYIGLWCMLNENYFISISTGSTGQTDLPRERLKNSLLILPSQEILQKFNNIVKSIQSKIFSSQFENENLENMRNTLLPKLINGEIHV